APATPDQCGRALLFRLQEFTHRYRELGKPFIKRTPNLILRCAKIELRQYNFCGRPAQSRHNYKASRHQHHRPDEQ
ncbi:MAG: hypothetical protein ACK5UX_05440, partial [Burkholderiales bacterium]